MSDNKNLDEEYHYVEESEAAASEPSAEQHVKNDYVNKINELIKQPSVKRNALIVVVALFILVGVLKCATSPNIKQEFDKPKPVAPQNINQVPTAPRLAPQINEANNIANMVANNIASVSGKIDTLSAQVESLSNRNASLEQQISQLSFKLESMQNSVNKLAKTIESRPQAKTVKRHYVPSKSTAPRVNYFVQAVIPGRAWLINSNGDTVTVRVGTSVSGYGVVKLIDHTKGRVLMSSGKVFQFSQTD